MFLTRVHDGLLCTGMAELADPNHAPPARLRTAARAYQAALDDLARPSGLAA